MRTKTSLGLMFVAILLAGCGEQEQGETVQTVDWYRANSADRAAILAKCRANPGELGLTANCVNASQAANAVTWGARGSGIKPVAPPSVNDLKAK